MELNKALFIGIAILSGVLFIALVVLFFVSRKTQKTMNSVLQIMLAPERAKINDATRVLESIMALEMSKISACFQNIHQTLKSQIDAANELQNEFEKKNTALVATANDAVGRVSQMSGRMDNTVSGLKEIVESSSWADVSTATDRFASTVSETLEKITTTTTESANKISQINGTIDNWNNANQQLANDLQQALDKNTDSFQNLTTASDNMREHISTLGQSVADGFSNIKTSAADYEKVLDNNNKILNTYLTKLDTFGKQSKKQLAGQMTTLTNTANVVGAQVLLAESSVEKQARKLTDMVETMMASATETETAVRNISNELTGLTNHFEGEIKDFATGVVSQLESVSGVANTTLKDTKAAANAFSESVKTMATGVRETLIEMNTAHTQLSQQSESLIKVSTETTAQLKPLSELIEKYYAALPDLAQTSGAAGETLGKIIQALEEKISNIRATVEQSTATVSESAARLEGLAGQSRQQMIDLMSDYAKAVDTMQTLNKQMMVARAAAPMDAIANAGTAAPMPRASSRDFLAQSGREFDKMYEQTIDLTRAMSSDIPDVVWKKYHGGDKTIFAKWLAKTIKATNKKQIQELVKSDSVFRSQATQFVRSFDKIMTAARQTDEADKLAAALVKTDLGAIYTALSQHL